MTTALAAKEEFKVTMADIKKYLAPTATDNELFLFMGICKSFGLNPMKREVHLIKYGNNPASIVTGYEVYLKRAERTKLLDGWHVDVAEDGQSATVTIHRKDWSQPFKWTAYRKEFDKGQANWKSMPSFMLRKVAIAQAFRLCFSDELGGMPYVPEEMPQDKGGGVSYALPKEVVEIEENGSKPEPAAEDVPVMATPEQVKKIQIMMREQGVETREEILEILSGFVERVIKSSKELTLDEAHQWISEHEAASPEVE